MSKRLGFIGIIIENRKIDAPIVNKTLSEFADIIVARMGLPYNKRHLCVITLIVDATNEEIGALAGKLGAIKGVTVKSALGKENKSCNT